MNGPHPHTAPQGAPSPTHGHRQPGYELLRIVAMLMIVLLHLVGYGLYADGPVVEFGHTPAGLLEYIAMQTVYLLSASSVNLYVMITGYFMVTASAKWEKIPKIWLQTAFYAVGLYLLFIGCGRASFFWGELAGSVVAIGTCGTPGHGYWFVEQYLGLVALSPFINLTLRKLSSRQYALLTAVLWAMDFSVLRFGLGPLYGGDQSLFHFIVIYTTAGGLRRFAPLQSVSSGRLGAAMAITVALAIAGTLAIDFRIHHTVKLLLHSPFLNYNGLAMINAVILFTLTGRLRISPGHAATLIGRLAPCSLGVYLIHENAYMRQWIWQELLPHCGVTPHNVLLYAIAIPAAVYWSCAAADELRGRLFKLAGADKGCRLAVASGKRLWAKATGKWPLTTRKQDR